MLQAQSRASEYRKALGEWTGLIRFLMVQEFDWRFKSRGVGRFATILAVLEPMLMVGIILLFRGVVKGVLPQYGTSLVVFISSGVFPFYVFLYLTIRTRVPRYDASHRLPRVSSTEAVISSILSETILIYTALVVWFGILAACGIPNAVPSSPAVCVLVLILLTGLGVGVGLINAAISRRFALWTFIFSIPGRALLFLSGAYYVVDTMPYRFRSIIVMNPLAHGMEWYRAGQYGTYPTLTLDKQYFVVFCAVTLLLGIVAHRLTIRSERSR
jgi:capsular polysaccharide transport system permease protein